MQTPMPFFLYMHLPSLGCVHMYRELASCKKEAMAAAFSSNVTFFFTSLLLYCSVSTSFAQEIENDRHYYGAYDGSLPQSDMELLEFPLNLEYLEAEFFCWSALGHGLDKIDRNLTMGGPPPIGARKANLSPLVRDIALQFCYQEVGHLRAIKKHIRGFPRPLLDISTDNFAKTMDTALNYTLDPPFDPYANTLNFLLASYLLPYVGLTGYVGANPKLQSPQAKRLVAGLLGVESAQDAVIRALLYERGLAKVKPYEIKAAEFTAFISDLRNALGKKGIKDEGLVVPPMLGPEGQSAGNVIAGDKYSLAYDRTPEEILSIVYGTASASKPGGFYPKGADGRIARAYLGI